MSRQKTGGVAIITKKTAESHSIEIADEFVELKLCAMHSWIPIDKGNKGYHISNIYFPTGSDQKHQRKIITQQAFEHLAIIGDLPIVISADWQEPPECNETLTAAILTGTWHDIIREHDTAIGRDTKATFSKTKFKQPGVSHGSSRIDYFIVSELAKQKITDTDVIQHLGFPGHAAIKAGLNVSVFSDKELVRQKPKPFIGLPIRPQKTEGWKGFEIIAHDVAQSHLEALAEALNQLDVEAAWTVANKMATEFLIEISDHETSLEDRPVRGGAPLLRRKAHRAEML